MRASGSSGQALRTCELWVDGKRADAENHPYVDMAAGITRLPYSNQSLSWYPGWALTLAAGERIVELRWPEGQPSPAWIIDAVCLQARP